MGTTAAVVMLAEWGCWWMGRLQPERPVPAQVLPWEILAFADRAVSSQRFWYQAVADKRLCCFFILEGASGSGVAHLLPLMNSDVDFSKEPLIPKKAALALKGKPHISDQYLNFQVTHFNFILSLLFFFIFMGFICNESLHVFWCKNIRKTHPQLLCPVFYILVN